MRYPNYSWAMRMDTRRPGSKIQFLSDLSDTRARAALKLISPTEALNFKFLP
jgi:hypothetical protein